MYKKIFDYGQQETHYNTKPSVLFHSYSSLNTIPILQCNRVLNDEHTRQIPCTRFSNQFYQLLDIVQTSVVKYATLIVNFLVLTLTF